MSNGKHSCADTAAAPRRAPLARATSLVVLSLLCACQVYDDGLLFGTGRAPAIDSCDQGCVCTLGEDGTPTAMTCEPESTTTPEPAARESCPPDCTDGNPCTRDIWRPQPNGACPLCIHEDMHEAANGDGCCPPATTAREDDDCAPVCGNRVVEPGELCDPCPDSCDDRDGCSVDTRVLGANACNARCMHTPLPASAEADRCCPPGGDAQLDPDCAECGNGVTEVGEECDGGGRCSNECKVLFPAALIHRYSFQGRGTTLLDSVGRRDGQSVNCELDGTGALELPGGTSNQYAALPSGLLSALSGVSIEAWLRWNGGGIRQRVFDFGMNTGDPNATSTGPGTSYFYLTPNGDGDRLAAHLNFTASDADAGDDLIADAAGPLSTGEVHHLVVTFGEGVLRLYLDSALQDERAEISGTLDQIDDRNSWIGRANAPEDELSGAIYEFRIYDRALTATEIEASYAAGPNP